MPVFQEEASNEMLERDASFKEPALPRLTAPPPTNPSPLDNGARHEVVVVGTGPAGMMLSLMLARYGVSVLPVERQTSKVISGHADGIQPRTLEVLRVLGLSEQIFAQGNPNHRIAFWNPKKGGGIERTAVTDDVTVPSRYPHKILLAAGRVVGILERQMNRYGAEAHRGIEFVGFEVEGSGEWPVKVKLKEVGSGREFFVRTKHLVGADGAHSKVRMGMGARLEGENTDYIWGVIDAVVKTDFPDIRKRCAIHSESGSIMCIPREKIENGQYLTRLYTQMEADVALSSKFSTLTTRTKEEEEASYQRALAQRKRVTLPRILEQVRQTISPYKIDILKVDWWAAYHIGQRVSQKFAMKDKNGLERIFIMGDACHTHSPKAGQGMNVSMMDAYNLGWKLAHELLGLAPRGSLLPTYELERQDIAQQLIDFDNAFAAKFSQKIGETSHEEFFKVFHSGGGFTSGCGIEYRPSNVVDPTTPSAINTSLDPDLGSLRPGRRLANISIRSFADDVPRELHDVLPPNGRYVVLLFLPKAFRSNPSFQRRLKHLGVSLPGRYVPQAIEPFVIHPLASNDDLEWTDLPTVFRDEWSRNLLGDVTGRGYETLGVDADVGVVAAVRPDGVIGALWPVEELQAGGRVEKWLDANLKVVGARKEGVTQTRAML